MTEPIQSTVIRIKLQEMAESVELIERNLPDSVGQFRHLGLIKDGSMPSRTSSMSAPS